MFAWLRHALPAAERAALDAAHHTRMVATGTPAFALGMVGRVAADEALDTRADLPLFAAWREAHATPRAARAEDAGAVAPADGEARHAS